MDEKTLKEVIKARKELQKKYKALKSSEADSMAVLEDTFKPITEPLREIVRKSKLKKEEISVENTYPKNSIKFESTPIRADYIESTPIKGAYTNKTGDLFKTPSNSMTRNLEFENLYLKYLNFKIGRQYE